jgi:quercetin dioxygenase-like cupin family protein
MDARVNPGHDGHGNSLCVPADDPKATSHRAVAAAVVLEGTFLLRVGKGYKQKIEAKPGDVVWLPEGTPRKYEGDKAAVFYALDPADRRQRHGMA